jgi:hypothetical protein
LIRWKPGFSGKMFWTLEIPFKTSFAVLAIPCLGPGSALFPSDFSTEIYAFLVSPVRGTCPAHLFLPIILLLVGSGAV